LSIERLFTFDAIILVTAIRITGAIHVIFQQVDTAIDPVILELQLGVMHQLIQDGDAGLFLSHHVHEAITFGGGVFRMATDVKIQPTTIFQEDVAAAPPSDYATEENSRHFDRTEATLSAEIESDAKLCFQTEDSSEHRELRGQNLGNFCVRKSLKRATFPDVLQTSYL